MDTIEPSKKPSVDFRPSWYERVMHWSGWEQMVEHWRVIVGVVVVSLLAVGGIGWFLVQNEVSSVQATLRVERIGQRLESPGSLPEKTDVQLDVQQLQVLAPISSSLGERFSGILAEEAVLQHQNPIDPGPFQESIKVLSQADLSSDALITSATLLSKQGLLEEAVEKLDQVIAKGFEERPNTYVYALLQKAALLHDRNLPNESIIQDLKRFLTGHPKESEVVEGWLSSKGIRSIDDLFIAQ